jgi:hypothetical protein
MRANVMLSNVTDQLTLSCSGGNVTDQLNLYCNAGSVLLPLRYKHRLVRVFWIVTANLHIASAAW